MLTFVQYMSSCHRELYGRKRPAARGQPVLLSPLRVVTNDVSRSPCHTCSPPSQRWRRFDAIW